jgi:hypothetical protein
MVPRVTGDAALLYRRGVPGRQPPPDGRPASEKETGAEARGCFLRYWLRSSISHAWSSTCQAM